MNNSKIAIDHFSLEEDPEVDRKPWLRQREGKLVKIIKAVKKVAGTDEWSSLKNHVFDGVVDKLEKELLSEAKKDSPNQLVLARLNGQLVWAKKYADLDKLADLFRKELVRIRQILYGKSES